MAGRLKLNVWGPYDDARGWLRGLAITLIAAAFMTLSKAFQSSGTLSVRFAYWLTLMILGWLWGAFVSRFIFRRIGQPKSLWWRVLVAALALSIPFSAVVFLATRIAFHAKLGLTDVPEVVLSVTVVSAVMIAINVLADRQMDGVTEASAEPPKFLERLPLKLRGGDLWAIEAEDHYLRLHTSKGQDLILMRLSDAIAELDGIEGAQVHRSWWIARDAITDARRGDGRATLTLKDGAEVPVSRTYAGMLRERGWI